MVPEVSRTGQYWQFEAWQWGRGWLGTRNRGRRGLICALTRWSCRFLALRLPKVMGVA